MVRPSSIQDQQAGDSLEPTTTGDGLADEWIGDCPEALILRKFSSSGQKSAPIVALGVEAKEYRKPCDVMLA